ncbi:hypothetical protein KEM48_004262 [Puccinia striiformis f. sp. tritici PST-130]|nr:hypothetical protein KEM48_004262 [Puccinia striiformis f. sp. tritici PST-130]
MEANVDGRIGAEDAGRLGPELVISGVGSSGGCVVGSSDVAEEVMCMNRRQQIPTKITRLYHRAELDRLEMKKEDEQIGAYFGH